MYTAAGDLHSIQQGIDDIVAACITADKASPQAGPETGLPVLAGDLKRLQDVMLRVQGDAGASGAEDITETGEYAIRLLEKLAASAVRLGLRACDRTLDELFINTGLWVARQGGLIATLEPVVDAVARVANNTREPGEIEVLGKVIQQIIDAVPAVISRDLENINPGRPWRVLLLNYCIVATRSYNTALMEAAFTLLTTCLPDEAPRFFTEGMQQMDALDYPDHVRTVMTEYHRKWNTDRSLH